MNEIIRLFNLIGSLICHQLPARTLDAGGTPLPVCARDTGIYLGLFVGTILIAAMGRFRSDMPPGILLSSVLCAFMVPMVIDGAGSYLGLYVTNNTIRLFTGIYFGQAIPFFLIPAANFKIHEKNSRIVLKNPFELIVLIAVNTVVCAAVLNGHILPYLVLGPVIAASIIFLIGRLCHTVITRARPALRHRFLTTIGAALCVLSVLYLVSAYILQPLKAMLLSGK